MKKLLFSSAVAAAIFAVYFAWSSLASNRASAQQPMTASVQGTGGIALVDVNYIFKKHARLKGQLTELQGEGEKVQKGFEEQLRQLQEESKKLGGATGFKPGSPEYTQLEEKLVNEKSYIQGQIALKRKEFVQREAHLYYNAYREISDEVAYFCQQSGISLVMNFNGDTIHEDNPDEVARGISNKVVFYNKGLDITPRILQRFLDKNAPAPTPSPSAFVPQPTR